MKNILYLISALIILFSYSILHISTPGVYTIPWDGASSELAEAIGRSLAYMLVAYPVWKWLTSKSFLTHKNGNAFLCYSILILLCSSYQSINMRTKANQLKKSEKAMSALLKASLTGESLIQEKFPRNEYGDIAPLLSLIKEVVEFSNQEAQKLNLSLAKVDLKELLQPNYLHDFEKLQEALCALTILNNELVGSESRMTQRMIQLDNEFTDLVRTHYKGKKSILDSYNISKQKNLTLTNEYYRIMADFIFELQQIINHLIEIQGSYWIENNTLTFETNTLVEKYNTHIYRIFEIAKEEELILKKIQDDKQATVDDWDSEIN